MLTADTGICHFDQLIIKVVINQIPFFKSLDRPNYLSVSRYVIVFTLSAYIMYCLFFLSVGFCCVILNVISPAFLCLYFLSCALICVLLPLRMNYFAFIGEFSHLHWLLSIAS